MVSCVFAGSFDPVTNGHLDLIRRCAGVFERVTVTLMVNIHKAGTIPPQARLAILEKVCAPFENVRVDQWSGLLTDYMRERGERVLVRGLRSGAEFDQEYASFLMNRQLYPPFETLYWPVHPSVAGLSSGAVREIAHFGGDIRSLVPEAAAEEISRWLSKE